MSAPSETTPPAAPSVSGAEIGEFLKGNQTLESGITLPITAADIGIENKATAAPVATSEKPPVDVDPTFDAELKTQGNIATTELQNGKIQFKPEDVALTDSERESFLSALLTDEPVTLTLRLPGWKTVPFVIKSRSNAEQRTMFFALEQDEKEKTVMNAAEWLQNLQYYGAAYQVVSIGKKGYNTLAVHPEAKLEASAETLRTYTKTNFLPLSTLKWYLITAALRLFEAKTNLAANELILRDFSQPAG